jgi:chromosome partitioning protein
MPATIAMLNQKGGVGKSSTCHHLAGAFAAMGRRILLVDNDPQSSLTQGLLGPAVLDELDPARTVAAILRGDDPFPDRVVQPSGIAGVDLVPGSQVANDSNVPRPHEAPAEAQGSLRAFLADVKAGYDLVLIDNPPTLSLCSWASLVAADFLIVPLQAEDYGAQGVRAIADTIERVLAGPNPALGLLGYLVTMFNARLAIHKAYEQRLRAAYGPDVFDVMVPYAADFKEAIASRKTIAAYKPRGASAKVVKALADEVLARMAARTTARTEAA